MFISEQCLPASKLFFSLFSRLRAAFFTLDLKYCKLSVHQAAVAAPPGGRGVRG